MNRTAFVDDKLFAAEFRTGDSVRKSNIREFILTPFVGRVLFSNTDVGKVHVQWPWGAEQEDPTLLVKVATPENHPPQRIDTSYDTWEKARFTGDAQTEKDDKKWRSSLASQIALDWQKHTRPVYNAACLAVYSGVDQSTASAKIASMFGAHHGPDEISQVVGDVFEGARRFAIYWKDSTRKYKATAREREGNYLSCPRCASKMKPRTYRHQQAIQQCRNCGFSIASEDII